METTNSSQKIKSGSIDKIKWEELIFWCLVVLLSAYYYRYSEPVSRFYTATLWWKRVLSNSFEKQDLPTMNYGRISYSGNSATHEIYFDGNITNLNRDSSFQILVSIDNYPNGRKDIPFLENKAVYAPDSALLPMYWSAPCPAWLEMKFPVDKVIDRIEITPNADEYGAGDYEILVWNNRANNYISTNPPSRYNGRAGKFKVFTFEKVITDKVKIVIVKGGTGNNYAYIKDIKVYAAKD